MERRIVEKKSLKACNLSRSFSLTLFIATVHTNKNIKMIVYNHRMLEGSPIQYYQPSQPIPIPQSQSSKFSYFNRFQNFSSSPTYEDLVMPHSPNGMQSDSDNSVSSLDVFPREIKLNQIAVEGHKNEDVQCKWMSCGIVFESLDQLSAHVSQVHASSGPGGLFYCGWEGCQRNNKGFNARYKMLVHVRTHTNEKPHKCFQCDKAFSRAENLKIHSRSHSGEKPYTCPVPGCQKAYSNSSDRFKHTRTHQVDKPYQCKVLGCPKRYTDPSSLRKHVKTYKHYVTDDTKNSKITETTENLRNLRKDSGDSASPKSDNSVTGDNCTCTHTCCINKSSNLLKLDAFINLSNRDITPWNKFLDPFSSEPKIFKPYELMDEEMNIDLPLDLSMSHCST